MLGRDFGDRTHRDVGRTAGRPRHDQVIGLIGIFLRARLSMEQSCCRNRRGQHRRNSLHGRHFIPLAAVRDSRHEPFAHLAYFRLYVADRCAASRIDSAARRNVSSSGTETGGRLDLSNPSRVQTVNLFRNAKRGRGYLRPVPSFQLLDLAHGAHAAQKQNGERRSCRLSSVLALQADALEQRLLELDLLLATATL